MCRLDLVQLESVEQIRGVAADWDRLWTKSEATLPTARAELVAQWLEHFAPQTRPRILAVEQDGRMVAALPLVDHRRWRALTVGDLTWNYWSPNGELLLDPAADGEAVLGMLAEAIRRLDWPLFWLELVPLASSRWQTLLAGLREQGMSIDVRPHYEIGQVELVGQFAEYEAHRPRSLRRNLRKDMQRLERNGPVELEVFSQFSPDEVEPRLRRAFEIENRSWKSEAGCPVLRTPGMLEFYVRQAQQLAEWGALRVAFLEHQGRAIAFELGWVAKGVYHSFKVGFDADYARYGPGHLLRHRLIAWLFEQADVQVVDFQGPLTEALAGWSTRTYPIGRVLAGQPTLRGQTLMAGYRAVAPLVRWLRGTPSGSQDAVVSLPNSEDPREPPPFGGDNPPWRLQSPLTPH
ncbi:MAG: GNAT family N-acetyltransferase [Thermoguttaceae bacterium]